MSFCTSQSSSRLGGTCTAISDETELRFGEFNVPSSTGWAGSSGLASVQPPLDSRSLIWLQGASLSLIHSYIFCLEFFTFTVARSEARTSGQR